MSRRYPNTYAKDLEEERKSKEEYAKRAKEESSEVKCTCWKCGECTYVGFSKLLRNVIKERNEYADFINENHFYRYRYNDLKQRLSKYEDIRDLS